VQDPPPFLCELSGFGSEAAYRELDAVPIGVRHLSQDVRILFLANAPPFRRRPFDIESTYVGSVSQAP
jgi:hypothetical protein